MSEEQNKESAKLKPLLLSDISIYEITDAIHPKNTKKVLGIKDDHGGVYSPDGKEFIKWDGPITVEHYSIRPGVEKICNDAFARTSLDSIELPDGLRIIGDRAFYETSLHGISLPGSLIWIGDDAFSCIMSPKCSSVRIPDNVEHLGDSCFFSSAMLGNITLPASLNHIGNKCFALCYNLSSIVVDSMNPCYSSKDGALYDKAMKKLICLSPFSETI